LVTEIRAGQAPTPEEAAPRAAVFREEESRPLPVMARASEREQKVGKVMAIQVIQDRLEGEAHQEEKTDLLTDHMGSHMIKMQDLILNLIIPENLIAVQQTDLIADVMKDLPVVHQIVLLVGRRDHQETDPIVDVMKDLHQNQVIVLTKEQKEVQEIQLKDHIVVVQRDHHQNQVIVLTKEQNVVQEIQPKDHIAVIQRDLLQNQEIVHTKEQKEVLETQPKDHIVAVQRDHLQNQEIVHTKEQNAVQEIQPKDHIAAVQKDHQNQVIVHSEEPRDHHLMLTKAKSAVRTTDLKTIHRNVLLAELKSPLESQMIDQPVVVQKDHLQNQVIVHTKDQKNHFVTRITNRVATELKSRVKKHQIVPTSLKDLHAKLVKDQLLNARANVMAKANLLIVHREKLLRDLNVNQNQAG